jgi:hypothetical protein
MPIVTKLREFLEAHSVPYSVHSHPTAYTAQEIAALQHVKGRQLAKVVIVKAGTAFAMLVRAVRHPSARRSRPGRAQARAGSDLTVRAPSRCPHVHAERCADRQDRAGGRRRPVMSAPHVCPEMSRSHAREGLDRSAR